MLPSRDRPEITLVLIGANDSWTVPAPPEDAKDITWQQLLWNHSRVFRLLFMIARAAHGVSSQTSVEVTVRKPTELQAASSKVRLGERELDMTTGAVELQRLQGKPVELRDPASWDSELDAEVRRRL